MKKETIPGLNRIISILSSDITIFGSSTFMFFLVLLFFSIGEIFLSLRLLLGLALSILITVLVRLFYFKERPKKISYKNIIEQIDSSSFPSAHSMRAGIMFVIIGISYYNIAILILMGIIAGIISISRYLLKKHYPEDILWGLSIGIILGFLTLILV